MSGSQLRDEAECRRRLARDGHDVEALLRLAEIADGAGQSRVAIELRARALAAGRPEFETFRPLVESAFAHVLIEGKRALLAERMAAGPTIVSSGPFQGMVLAEPDRFSFFSVLPKLIGCYEAELHDAIERIVQRVPARVVNFGCAEGYYAVGMARRLPRAQIVAGDIDQDRLALCGRMAAVNGVDRRLSTCVMRSPADLKRVLVEPMSTVLMVDCEGAEVTYLDPVAVPGTRHCDILVEAHQFVDAGIADLLIGRYRDTHAVTAIELGPRNPHNVPWLAGLPEPYRWIAMDEGRPTPLKWLWLERRSD